MGSAKYVMASNVTLGRLWLGSVCPRIDQILKVYEVLQILRCVIQKYNYKSILNLNVV